MWDYLLPIVAFAFTLYEPISKYFANSNVNSDPGTGINGFRSSSIAYQQRERMNRTRQRGGGPPDLFRHVKNELNAHKPKTEKAGKVVRGMWDTVYEMASTIPFPIRTWNRTLYHVLVNQVRQHSSGGNDETVEVQATTLFVSVSIVIILLLALHDALGYWAASIVDLFFSFEATAVWLGMTLRDSYSSEEFDVSEGLRVFLLMFFLRFIDSYFLDLAEQTTVVWRLVVPLVLTTKWFFNDRSERSSNAAPAPSSRRAGLSRMGSRGRSTGPAANGGHHGEERSYLQILTDLVYKLVPIIGIDRNNARKTMDGMEKWHRVSLVTAVLWLMQHIFTSNYGGKKLAHSVIWALAYLEGLRCTKTPARRRDADFEDEDKERQTRNMLCFFVVMYFISIVESIPMVFAFLATTFHSYVMWKTVFMLVLIYANAPVARGGDNDEQDTPKLAEMIFRYIYMIMAPLKRAASGTAEEDGIPREPRSRQFRSSSGPRR